MHISFVEFILLKIMKQIVKGINKYLNNTKHSKNTVVLGLRIKSNLIG